MILESSFAPYCIYFCLDDSVVCLFVSMLLFSVKIMNDSLNPFYDDISFIQSCLIRRQAQP